MNNAQRAAILLLGMGQEQASEVLRHMDPKQVERLAQTMNEMSEVDEEQISEVLQSFLKDSTPALNKSANDYFRQAVIDALGDDKARTLLDKNLVDDQSSELNALKWYDTETLVEYISDEHPQVIAVILNYLDSEQAAEVVQLLPDNLRVEVIKRVATIGAIAPVALDLLDEMLEEHSLEVNSYQSVPLGGAKTAASIINFLDSSIESKVISELESTDDELKQEVQGLIYPFENLLILDDQSMQKLLHEIPTDILAFALRAADAELKDKCMKNVTARIKAVLKVELDEMAPVPLKAAISAQKQIVMIAQKLAKHGVISLENVKQEVVSGANA